MVRGLDSLLFHRMCLSVIAIDECVVVHVAMIFNLFLLEKKIQAILDLVLQSDMDFLFWND